MHGHAQPSTWVQQCLDQWVGSKQGKRALDLACGEGRHSVYLAAQGFEVLAVDRQVPTRALGANVRFQQLDLELDEWPLSDHSFDLIVVTNYLYRPHFESLLACLAPGGTFVMETFMVGNERYGSPRNPDFLLQPGELIERCHALQIVNFQQGLRVAPTPAVIQRVMAIQSPWTEIQSLIQIQD